jgi:hypothetical protein
MYSVYRASQPPGLHFQDLDVRVCNVLFLKNKFKNYFCLNLKQQIMADNLEYIRKAIQKDGKFARVKVLRYETNMQTGLPEKPDEIEVSAFFALQQLEKPYNKRIHNYKKIRPIGESAAVSNAFGLSNLESPELMNMIKEQAKAELEAEIRAKILAEQNQDGTEKPKRKKKTEDSETHDLDSI